MLDGASRGRRGRGGRRGRRPAGDRASPTTATCTASCPSTRRAVTHGIKPISARALHGPRAPHRADPDAGARSTTPAARARAGRSPTTTSPCWPRRSTGYRNLIQLSTPGLHGGLLPQAQGRLGDSSPTTARASSPPPGCLGGHVLQALLRRRLRRAALQKAGRLQDIFGRDNLFVELQDHGIPEQHRTNPLLFEIARELGAPLLATNDSHYTHRRRRRGATTPCSASRPAR